MKLIEERDFIFTVNMEKAFQKLTSQQFTSPEAALVREPLANALDANSDGSASVRISFSQPKGLQGSHICFQNHSNGLTDEDLEGLHFLGRSSKRNDSAKIGQFGLGFVAAFNPEFGVSRVSLDSIYQGLPVRIVYHTENGKLPSWQFSSPIEVDGTTTVTYDFSPTSTVDLEPLVENVLSRVGVPINVNGEERQLRDWILVSEHEQSCHIEDDDGTLVLHALRENAGFDEITEPIRIFVKGLLVEEGHNYNALTGSTSEKRCQMVYRSPFVLNEETVVFSNSLSTTVGRDKVIRNEEFEGVKKLIDRARAKNLLARLRHLENSEFWSDGFKEFESLCLSNLGTLKYQIVEEIKGEGQDVEVEIRELIRYLLNARIFKNAFGREERLTLRETYEASKDLGFLFFGFFYDPPPAGVDENRITMLVEDSLDNRYFGGSDFHIVQDALRPILSYFNVDVVYVRELAKNPGSDRFKLLFEKGVMASRSVKFREYRKNDVSAEHAKLMTTLNDKFSEEWCTTVLRSLSTNSVKEIRVVPLSEMFGKNQLCYIFPPDTGTLKIGLNLGHETLIWASSLGGDRWRFLLPAILNRFDSVLDVPFELVDYVGTANSIDEFEESKTEMVKKLGPALMDEFVATFVTGILSVGAAGDRRKGATPL